MSGKIVNKRRQNRNIGRMSYDGEIDRGIEGRCAASMRASRLGAAARGFNMRAPLSNSISGAGSLFWSRGFAPHSIQGPVGP
jgi:hypothetical protein